jgi:hypothetical protein
MHKVAKLDEFDEPIYENEEDRKYGELRAFYPDVPLKIFDKAFNKLFKERGIAFEGSDLNMEMTEDLEKDEMRRMEADMNKLKG